MHARSHRQLIGGVKSCDCILKNLDVARQTSKKREQQERKKKRKKRTTGCFDAVGEVKETATDPLILNDEQGEYRLIR